MTLCIKLKKGFQLMLSDEDLVLNTAPLTPQDLFPLDEIDELSLVAKINSYLISETYKDHLKKYSLVVFPCSVINSHNFHIVKRYFNFRTGWNVVECPSSYCSSACDNRIIVGTMHYKFIIVEKTKPSLMERLFKYAR